MTGGCLTIARAACFQQPSYAGQNIKIGLCVQNSGSMAHHASVVLQQRPAAGSCYSPQEPARHCEQQAEAPGHAQRLYLSASENIWPKHGVCIELGWAYARSVFQPDRESAGKQKVDLQSLDYTAERPINDLRPC